MNNPLSAARRILQLGEAATKGPWIDWASSRSGFTVSRLQPEYPELDMMYPVASVGGDGSNAAFIAAARSAPEVCEALLRCHRAMADMALGIAVFNERRRPEERPVEGPVVSQFLAALRSLDAPVPECPNGYTPG